MRDTILRKNGTEIRIEGGIVYINGVEKSISNVSNYFIRKLTEGFVVVPATNSYGVSEVESDSDLVSSLRDMAKKFYSERMVGITERTIEKLVSTFNKINWDNEFAARLQAELICRVVGVDCDKYGSINELRDALYKVLTEYSDFDGYNENDVTVKVDIRELSEEEIKGIERRCDFRYERGKHRVYAVNGGSRGKLYYHGTRNENCYNILATGFKIRPAGAVLTGSMFGNGVYFADKYKKSRGYTSLSGSYWARGSERVGYLLLCDVNLGRTYRTTGAMPSGAGSGYDSISAMAGSSLFNNEYVVYDESRARVSYIVEERI